MADTAPTKRLPHTERQRFTAQWHPSGEVPPLLSAELRALARNLDRLEGDVLEAGGLPLEDLARLDIRGSFPVPVPDDPPAGAHWVWAVRHLQAAAGTVAEAEALVARADLLARAARGAVVLERRRWRVLAGRVSRSVGTRTLARALGVHPMTVAEWRGRGSAPGEGVPGALDP